MPTDHPKRRVVGPGGFDAIGARDAVSSGTVMIDVLLADGRDRAAAHEPQLGAVVTPLSRQSEEAGPLRGAVVAVKDLIGVEGVVRGCGAPEMVERGYLDAEPQPADATVVARTVAAGGSLLATVSTHPLAFGLTTPQTQNPAAPGHVIGGSSGGSAAALAAGMCHLALGSDTGGSIRVPASATGMVGLKTTRGRVPLTGVQPLSWSLDSVGPMASTVADLALYLPVIDGVDDGDPVSRPPPERIPDPAVRRIGVPNQIEAEPIDPQVRAIWERTLAQLTDEGYEIVRVDLPIWPDTAPAASKILMSEAVAVHRRALTEAPDTIHPAVRVRLEDATSIPSWEVGEAHQVARQFRADVRRLWERADVLCTPTIPCRVPEVGAATVDVDGHELPVTPALKQLVASWNLAEVPAGTVPAGVDADGIPVGVQVIGPEWGEARVLEAMAQVERLTSA